MIVDDDLAVLAALRFALEAEGYIVITYHSAADALEATTFPEKGCFVIDYFLSDMTGIDLLARLRSAGNNQPALIVTPHAGPRILQQAGDIGAPVVEKPFVGSELSDKIRMLIESSA